MIKLMAAKRRTVSLCTGALIAGAALCASSPAASAAAQAPPPELAPLLQKTSELEISSERFSGELAITGKKVPSKLKALGGLKVKVAGEEGTSPEAAAITETSLGTTISLRLVNHAIYIRDASIAKHDGGRPWVQESTGASTGLFGSHTTLGSGSGGSSGASSSSRFKTEIALLKASNDVRSLGAGTIDGQAVTGFAGTANPKEIEESSLPAKLRAEIVKSHIKPSATFEVFIAANGLPVHSHVVLALRGVKLNVTEDVLAIDFPVAAIAPPPAAETITAAQLKKLLAKQLKKKKKR
jgi:hypothetical protein